MITPPESDSVFPLPLGMDSNGNLFQRVKGGISLRDYFAAKAMQAYIASAIRDPSHPTMRYDDNNGADIGHGPCLEEEDPAIAAAAYYMADAMLAERAE